jgi:protein SCO1
VISYGRGSAALKRRIAIAVALSLATLPLAHAKLTRTALSEVQMAPQTNATLPLKITLQGESGETRPLDSWIGGPPTVWILADFTCQTLCGPVISIVADALRQTGLKPGAEFRFIVVGLDPKDTVDQGKAMKDAQVGEDGGLSNATFFLRANATDIVALTNALGFHAVYDNEYDQYAHPAVAFITTSDGRVARELPGLGLDPANLRLALVDASQNRIGTFTDHIRLLCYGFDPASGQYTPLVGTIITGAAVVTIIGLVLLIAALLWRERAIVKG